MPKENVSSGLAVMQYNGIVMKAFSFLFSFPHRLLSLGKCLADLNMSMNKISSLPSEFGCFSKLSSLDLR